MKSVQQSRVIPRYQKSAHILVACIEMVELEVFIALVSGKNTVHPSAIVNGALENYEWV